jgi:hypothetical protein
MRRLIFVGWQAGRPTTKGAHLMRLSTGTHDYQGVTNGYVEIAGQGYQAAAYDQVDNIGG